MPSAQDYAQYLQPILMLAIMFALFYFMVIRPQRKRDKEERDMRSSIQIGDEISTIGGFIGKVVGIKDDVLTIETSSDRTKLRVYRWAIRAKEAAPTEAMEAPKDAK